MGFLCPHTPAPLLSYFIFKALTSFLSTSVFTGAVAPAGYLSPEPTPARGLRFFNNLSTAALILCSIKKRKLTHMFQNIQLSVQKNPGMPQMFHEYNFPFKMAGLASGRVAEGRVIS